MDLYDYKHIADNFEKFIYCNQPMPFISIDFIDKIYVYGLYYIEEMECDMRLLDFFLSDEEYDSWRDYYIDKVLYALEQCSFKYYFDHVHNEIFVLPNFDMQHFRKLIEFKNSAAQNPIYFELFDEI